MKKQQSSIDWLIDKFNEYPIEIGKAQFRKYLYEAKQLHKKEIIEANMSVRIEQAPHLTSEIIEKSKSYYNEKYAQ